jgi:TfoX/Sxy family transcriptional regulator of competence genes
VPGWQDGEVTEHTPELREALAQRIRDMLSRRDNVQEKAMFGGRAFMVDGHLAVSAGGDGSLLVRVDPADYDDLLREGAVPAAMNAERPMGRGWMSVPCPAIEDPARLAFWVAVGIDSRRGSD